MFTRTWRHEAFLVLKLPMCAQLWASCGDKSVYFALSLVPIFKTFFLLNFLRISCSMFWLHFLSSGSSQCLCDVTVDVEWPWVLVCLNHRFTAPQGLYTFCCPHFCCLELCSRLWLGHPPLTIPLHKMGPVAAPASRGRLESWVKSCPQRI